MLDIENILFQSVWPALERKKMDLESRVRDETHQSLRLWLRLLTCANLIESEIRRRLRGVFGISLARFDLMAQLERQPEGLKMSELSRRMMVSGGNVTGLTDQLEAEGLVARADDPHDRRAYTVRLTDAGHASFLQMAEEHEAWVIELLDGLSSAEQQKLFALLGSLKRSLVDRDKREMEP
jgi:DNA-binding MarR family transcriptional regulator